MSDLPNLAIFAQPPALAANAKPLVVEHALKGYTLLGRQVANAAQNGWASAALLPLVAGPETWQELLELQQAVIRQAHELQQGWLRGWGQWLEQFGQLRRVNTLSKLLEEEFNLVGQCLTLLQGQVTDVATLQESVEVNYGYWLRQQLDKSPEAAVA